MADTDVMVQFGAKIDDLVAGVSQAKEQIQSVGTSADSVGASFSKLGEIMAAAFSVYAISSTVEAMAELGVQTERTSAILGASVQQVGELGFLAKSTGGSSEGLAMSMERLQRNLLLATSNGMTPAAQALKSLGLNAKELLAMPIVDQLGLLADKFKQFADGGTKTATAITLGGRAFQQLIPELDKGSAGIKDLMDISVQYGAALGSSVIANLENVHLSTLKLDTAWTNLKATLVSTFSTAIAGAVTGMANFVINLSNLIGTGRIWESQLEGLAFLVKALASDLLTMGIIAFDAFSLDWGKIAHDWEVGMANDDKILRDHLYNMGVLALKAKADLAKDLAPPSTQAQMPASGINKDALGAAMAEAQAEIKIADEKYKTIADMLKNQVKQFNMTHEQETSSLLAALNVRLAAETAALNKELTLPGLTAAKKAQVEAQITELAQKGALDRQKILEAEIAAEQKEWTGYVNTIESSWNSSLRGLLAGTTTFGAAMKKVVADLIIYWIEQIEKKFIFEKMIAGLTTAFQISAVGTQTAAVTAGVAAQTTAQQAGAAAGIAMMIPNFIKAIMADAGQTFAGIFAFLAPTMGPAAAGPAAAGSAMVTAVAGGIGHAAAGTDYVASTGLAVIHQGEAIVPAQFNTPFSGGGGGVTVNLNVQAIDAKSFATMMNSNSGILTNLIKRAIRDGHLNLATAG